LDENLDRVLDALYTQTPSEGSFAQTKNRLKAALQEVLPPLVHYGLIAKTSIGPVWVAAGKKGLVGIDFEVSEKDLVAQLEKDGRARAVRKDEVISKEIGQVRAYLEGKIDAFDMDVDIGALTKFQRMVLNAARQVPRGQVATYGEIAERIGKPRAFRAVGQALRNNPIPIVIPCHRVINADGTLGGYGGKVGSQRKIQLLQLEGAILA
jgi:O-6-methylguanine DNA methyltransferase